MYATRSEENIDWPAYRHTEQPEACEILSGICTHVVILIDFFFACTDTVTVCKASSNMLTAGAAAPAVKPPAPAVESKLWHCGGQAVSS